jgi:hypothetical protein
MQKYRLRAGKRDATGKVTQVSIDEEIWASSDAEAIKMSKVYQVCWYLDTSDYAWLTDTQGKNVWSLTLEES